MKTANRIAYVDGLRAIAVLSVVLFHGGVYNHAAQGDFPSALGLILSNGCHGVDLFFVLSGFCLAYPVLARLREDGQANFSLAGFAARRTVRILPPYYVAIAVLFAVGVALTTAGIALPKSMDPAAVSAAGVVKQMLFVDHRYLASSFWTLAIEFRWYFLFPVVLWVWTRSRAMFAIIALLSLAVAESSLHSYDLFFLPIFMLGIVAADIYISKERMAALALIGLPVFLIISVASTAHHGWYFVDVGPFWGISMFCFVVAAGSSQLIRTVLSQKWLVGIGTASYGIYLVHEPAIELIQRLLPRMLAPEEKFALAVFGAVSIGILFSYLAERPFVQSRLRDVLVTTIERAIHYLCLSCHFRSVMPMTALSTAIKNVEKTSEAVA